MITLEKILRLPKHGVQRIQLNWLFKTALFRY